MGERGERRGWRLGGKRPLLAICMLVPSCCAWRMWGSAPVSRTPWGAGVARHTTSTAPWSAAPSKPARPWWVVPWPRHGLELPDLGSNLLAPASQVWLCAAPGGAPRCSDDGGGEADRGDRSTRLPDAGEGGGSACLFQARVGGVAGLMLVAMWGRWIVWGSRTSPSMIRRR
jgi:hypothetical protein